jgi:hypothetical protein
MTRLLDARTAADLGDKIGPILRDRYELRPFTPTTPMLALCEAKNEMIYELMRLGWSVGDSELLVSKLKVDVSEGDRGPIINISGDLTL